ncbi:hypothetical protein N9230_02240 [Akkermansiaceae bacterium]|nr:hypothetical protein [Akkermansiaceae bacterium]
MKTQTVFGGFETPSKKLLLKLTSHGPPCEWRICSESMSWQLSGCGGADPGVLMSMPDEVLDSSLLEYNGFYDCQTMPRSLFEIEPGLSGCMEILIRRIDEDVIKSYNRPIAITGNGEFYWGPEYKNFEAHHLGLSDGFDPMDHFGHTDLFPLSLSSDFHQWGNGCCLY